MGFPARLKTSTSSGFRGGGARMTYRVPNTYR